jgi:hypothetical protein
MQLEVDFQPGLSDLTMFKLITLMKNPRKQILITVLLSSSPFGGQDPTPSTTIQEFSQFTAVMV